MTDWKTLPGGWDALNTKKGVYESSDPAYHIPDLLPQPTSLELPDNIFPVRFAQKIRTQRPLLLHFHIDDYRFERVWNNPQDSLRSVNRDQIWAACSPDFSLWLDYPIALQIFNTYRNRWMARYWQAHGVTIIPTVNWSHEFSYEFCFNGIPKHQIVTLRTYNVTYDIEHEYFLKGYIAMRKALEPRAILWFGYISDEIDDDIPKIQFQLNQRAEKQWAEEAQPGSAEQV